MIDVVSGILISSGRVLLGQRRPSRDFAFTWECPGGKVEGNETPLDALRREFVEEIGAFVERISAPVWSGEFSGPMSRPDRTHIRLTFYVVEECTGRVRLLDHVGLGWFTPEEMRRLTLTPGNARAMDAIAAAISARSGT